MELLPGYKLIKLTEDEIVQEKTLPSGGKVILSGNPHPDPVLRQKKLDELAEFLMQCKCRRQAEEKLRKEKNA